MATTGVAVPIPVPNTSKKPDIPGDMLLMAQAVAGGFDGMVFVRTFASSGAAATYYTANPPAAGARRAIATNNYEERYNGTVWKPVGALIPVIPASIAGSGCTLGPDGLITLSGATALSVNGAFTSLGDNYLVLADLTSATGGGPLFVLRAAGSDNTATQYLSRRIYLSGTNSVTSDAFTLGNVPLVANVGTIHSQELTLRGPALAGPTKLRTYDSTWSASANIGRTEIDTLHNVSSSFDGFTLTDAVALSGQIRIYMLNNE